MSKTALQLVRELAQRTGQYIPVYVDAQSFGASTSQIVSLKNKKYFPVDVGSLNYWCRANSGCSETSNRTEQHRLQSWVASTGVLQFYDSWTLAPGITALSDFLGGYDIFTRNTWEELLSAINDAVGLLDLYWWRPVEEASFITITAGTYKYALSSAVNWAGVDQTMIEVNSSLSTFPYEDAARYAPRIYDVIDSSGVQTWYIQFTHLPPVGRKVKFFGRAYISSFTVDSDVLAIGGTMERRILIWIMDYAKYTLSTQNMEMFPTSEMAEQRQKAADSLQRARDQIMAFSRPPTVKQIVTPVNKQSFRRSGGPRYPGIDVGP